MTNPDEFVKLLLVGSYVFSAGCYVFGFWIVRCLNRIQTILAKQAGIVEGQNLSVRVGNLELAMRRYEKGGA